MIALRATQASSAPVWQVCGESIGESAPQSDEVLRGFHAAVKKNEPWTMAHLPVADGRAIFGCDPVLGPGRGHQTGVAFLATIDLVTRASSVGRCTRRGSVVDVGATDNCIRALLRAILLKVSIARQSLVLAAARCFLGPVRMGHGC